MGQDFSPTPPGRVGMDLDFLNPPRPAHPHPRPHPASPRTTKGYNCKFSYPKILLFKQTYQY